jgi:hypothetical protein
VQEGATPEGATLVGGAMVAAARVPKDREKDWRVLKPKNKLYKMFK